MNINDKFITSFLEYVQNYIIMMAQTAMILK